MMIDGTCCAESVQYETAATYKSYCSRQSDRGMCGLASVGLWQHGTNAHASPPNIVAAPSNHQLPHLGPPDSPDADRMAAEHSKRAARPLVGIS